MVVHILGLQLQGSMLSVAAKPRRYILSVLTRVQSASAAAVAAFGLVHLSAPLVGLLHIGSADVNDRVDAVSRWMLLGRVAYQSGVGEAVLWTALAAHLVAGVAKRLVTRFTIARPTPNDALVPHNTEVTEIESSKTPTTARRQQSHPRKLSLAQLSGYMLTPFAIHHTVVNRLIPSSAASPISGLSPSELDYSFVSYTLSHSNLAVRTVMATAYALLITTFAIHTTYALPTLLRSLPNSANPRTVSNNPKSKARVAGTLTAVLLASLIAIVPYRSSDRVTISSTLKNRFDAVLQAAAPTSLFLRPS